MVPLPGGHMQLFSPDPKPRATLCLPPPGSVTPCQSEGFSWTLLLLLIVSGVGVGMQSATW